MVKYNILQLFFTAAKPVSGITAKKQYKVNMVKKLTKYKNPPKKAKSIP